MTNEIDYTDGLKKLHDVMMLQSGRDLRLDDDANVRIGQMLNYIHRLLLSKLRGNTSKWKLRTDEEVQAIKPVIKALLPNQLTEHCMINVRRMMEMFRRGLIPIEPEELPSPDVLRCTPLDIESCVFIMGINIYPHRNVSTYIADFLNSICQLIVNHAQQHSESGHINEHSIKNTVDAIFGPDMAEQANTEGFRSIFLFVRGYVKFGPLSPKTRTSLVRDAKERNAENPAGQKKKAIAKKPVKKAPKKISKPKKSKSTADLRLRKRMKSSSSDDQRKKACSEKKPPKATAKPMKRAKVAKPKKASPARKKAAARSDRNAIFVEAAQSLMNKKGLSASNEVNREIGDILKFVADRLARETHNAASGNDIYMEHVHEAVNNNWPSQIAELALGEANRQVLMNAYSDDERDEV